MKKIILLIIFLPVLGYSQNVGVGTSTPSEKLDVNGNINVNGTIKPNGMDGSSGQVLMKNSSGMMVWGDMERFKNVASFYSGSGNWTVPSGVTTIMVEVVGGGAGGIIQGGGGGGGYIMGQLNVTPGASVSWTVGAGGAGGAGGSGGAGNSSIVTYASFTFNANGGSSTTFNNATKAFASNGGIFSVTPSGFNNYIGMNGASGKANQMSFHQKSATSFFEISSGGDGGGPGYCRSCTSKGSYFIYDISAAAIYMSQLYELSNRLLPGTGGGGGYALSSYGGFGGGSTAANGAVIIHY